MRKFAFVLVFLVFGIACSRKVVPITSKNEAPKEEVVNYEKEGYVSGTIVDMTGLDGCGYMIRLENGKKLEPSHIEEQFRQNDLPVWIKYSIPKSAISICMAGQMVTLSAIHKR